MPSGTPSRSAASIHLASSSGRGELKTTCVEDRSTRSRETRCRRNTPAFDNLAALGLSERGQYVVQARTRPGKADGGIDRDGRYHQVEVHPGTHRPGRSGAQPVTRVPWWTADNAPTAPVLLLPRRV